MLRKKLIQLQEKPLASKNEAESIENKTVCMFVSSVKLVHDFHAVKIELLSVILYISWQIYQNIVRHLHYFM